MALPFTTALPGPYNVNIPAFGGKAQARLIESFARDPKKFAVNKLTQRTPTDLLSGHWLVLRPEALARVFARGAYIWVDGQPFPQGNYNAQDFRAVPYKCDRVALPDYLGEQTQEQAAWPIESTKLDALGHIMMTLRAQTFYDLTLTTSNHLASHVKTATAWSNIGGTGGFWSAGTIDNPIIKRSLLNIGNQIRKDTMATVTYKNLTLVVSPGAAIAMADSQEIHSYLARSVFALAQVRGDKPSQNGEWGLPDKLYDLDLVVDPTLVTTSARLAVPGTTTDVMDDNTALVMALPGQISENVGQVNSSFSSVHMFVYKGQEMVVKTMKDPWNQLTRMGIYETYDMKIVAPETTALATNLFS